MEARNDIVLYMDYDLATDLNDLPLLLRGIAEGYDIVIGSRYKGVKTKRSLYRHAWSKAYNFMVSLLFDTGIKDHQCGFKAFKRNVIRTLSGRQAIRSALLADGFGTQRYFFVREGTTTQCLKCPSCGQQDGRAAFALMREIKTVGYMLGLFLRLRR